MPGTTYFLASGARKCVVTHAFNLRMTLAGIGCAVIGVIILGLGAREGFDLPFWPWNGILAIVLGGILTAMSLRDIFRK